MALFPRARALFNLIGAATETPEMLHSRVEAVIQLAEQLGQVKVDMPANDVTAKQVSYEYEGLNITQSQRSLTEKTWIAQRGGVVVFHAYQQSGRLGISPPSPTLDWRLALRAAHNDVLKRVRQIPAFHSGYGHQ